MEKLKKIENEIIDFLKENDDILSEMVHACYMWDSSLDNYYYYAHDEEFYNIFFENRLDELSRAIYYSNNYNYNDCYIRFNAYGNLETASEYELKDAIIDGASEIFENWFNLYSNNSLDNDFRNFDFDDLLEKYEEACQ